VDTIALLRQLSEATGIAGQEAPVRELIREIWRPLVDRVSQDRLGNLVGLKLGTGPDPRPKLMVAAHMDEIGLIVTGAEREFLRVTRVGGTDRRVLLGLEVIVHGRRDVPGIIATRPPHVLSAAERKKTVPWDNMFVDTGLSEKEVGSLVSMGDLVSVRRETVELKNRRVAGKAMDDRACVAAVTVALEQLAHIRHNADVLAVATVQEEIGAKGAPVRAYDAAPDLAIALDVTFAEQPLAPKSDTFPLGEGPTIGLGPNFHPKLVQRLRNLAEQWEIPYHIEPLPGASGTDAWVIQVSRDGVPTALLSIPVRYMQPASRDTGHPGRNTNWTPAGRFHHRAAG